MHAFYSLLKSYFLLPTTHYAGVKRRTLRRAKQLYIVVMWDLLALPIVTAYLLFNIRAFPFLFIFMVLMLLVCIGPVPFVFLRKGNFKAARAAYWIAMVVGEVSSMWVTGGSLSPAFMVGLLTIVTMTSLLFDQRFSIATLIGTAILIGVLILVPPAQLGVTNVVPFQGEAVALLAYDLIHILLIGWLINYGYLEMDSALDKVERQGARIAASEARYRRFTQTTKDAIIVINRNGIIQFANQALQPMFGHIPEHLIGDRIDVLMPPELRSRHTAGFLRYQLTGERRLNWDLIEVPGYTKAGQTLDLEISFTEYEEEEEQFYIGFIRNVTEQKRADAALQHSSKIESIGILAGGIAHDFNNLLVGVLGQASLLNRKLEADSKLHKHVDRILLAARRAADLTQQMLAYSGQGQFTVVAVNLNQLLRENLALIETSIPETVDFVTDLTPDLPKIEADPTQMQQVLMNVIINAAQSMDGKRGLVTVRTMVQDYTDEALAALNVTWMTDVAAGKYVCIEVTDTGVGMPPTLIAQIFDPFFTTKESGSGLGLAAVLGIVKTHNGSLAVKSEVGKGTTFHLLFPCQPIA